MNYPSEMARCTPTKPCGQEVSCARRTWLGCGTIDGSVIHIRGFQSCPLFIDRRALTPVKPYCETEAA